MSTENVSARELGPGDDQVWDALVAAAPAANSFLRADCLDMLARTDSYGTRCRRVGAFAGGVLRGGWALPFRERSGFRYSTYFEFFYAGPFLAPDLESGSVHAANERMQILQALGRAQAECLPVIEAETHPNLTDIRPLLYSGWSAQPLYTHCWDMADTEAVWISMNREKRRLVRRTVDVLRFGFEAQSEVADAFLALYRSLIALISRDDRTAYLWRCAYRPDPEAHTVVPALYWKAALALREELGAPLSINFGGSPRASLTLFKDYLGARPVVHFRLLHDQPGWRVRAWRTLRGWKEWGRRQATRSGALRSWYGRDHPQRPTRNLDPPQ